MTPHSGKVAGTILVVGGIQFLLALTIAEALYPGYSIADNYISDLGVWSNPSAIVFNPSIMLFGATIIVASFFIKKHFNLGKIAYIFTIAGLGALMVGVFPENMFKINGVLTLHNIAALLAFVFGGIAALATYKFTASPFRYLSATAGLAVLVSFALFLATRDGTALGIGAGGLERMVAYPTVLGIIAFGGYMLGNKQD